MARRTLEWERVRHFSILFSVVRQKTQNSILDSWKGNRSSITGCDIQTKHLRRPWDRPFRIVQRCRFVAKLLSFVIRRVWRCCVFVQQLLPCVSVCRRVNIVMCSNSLWLTCSSSQTWGMWIIQDGGALALMNCDEAGWFDQVVPWGNMCWLIDPWKKTLCST